MTIHIPHPDIMTNGLWDSCERCQELAEDPMHSLDLDNRKRIWHGTLHTNTDLKALLAIRRYIETELLFT